MTVDAAPEVTLDALASRDEVVLVTTHNTYRFVVEEPGESRGLLRGGRLPADRTAFLCGVYDGPASFRVGRLVPGGRALFVVEEGHASGYRRLVTSSLVDVWVEKVNGER